MPTSVVVRRTLRVAWRLAAVVVAVVLLLVVSVAGVRAWNAGAGLNVRFDTLPNALPEASDPTSVSPASTPAPSPPPPVGAVVPGTALAGQQNILVMGIDSSSAEVRGASGANPPEIVTPESLRSVSIVNIPSARSSVSVVSLPPGTPLNPQATSTFTMALASGGVAAAVAAAEDLLGTTIDHVAAVDVRALDVMTDALGGLDAAALGGVVPNKTARTGTGERLSGAEVRHLLARQHSGGEPGAASRATAGDDHSLIEHRVVAALLAACERNGTFTDLRDTGELAQAMAPYIAVDEGLTVAYLGSIDLSLRDLTSDVRFGTLPTVPTSPTSKQAVPDEAALAALRQAFASDSVAAYLRAGS